MAETTGFTKNQGIEVEEAWVEKKVDIQNTAFAAKEKQFIDYFPDKNFAKRIASEFDRVNTFCEGVIFSVSKD